MRKASADYSIIVLDDKFIGISLGYDYCSEHEWGISGIKRLFGIPEPSKENMGVKSRTITICPKSLLLKEETYKKQKYAALFTCYHYSETEKNDELPYGLDTYKKDLEWRIQREIERPSKDRKPNDPIVTAWDEDSFGVGVGGEKEVGYLKELYEAFQNKNVCITRINLMPNNPFAGTSLSLIITDRLPKESTDAIYYVDKEYFDRIDYEEKICMTKIIAKYGNKNGYKGDKYFLACSPKWINYSDEKEREEQKAIKKTKFDILYWINYSDNDDNYGWYTVEEIKKWLTTPNLHLKEIRSK